MNIKRKSEYIGALGALLVHVAIIALLILVSFAIPHLQLPYVKSNLPYLSIG